MHFEALAERLLECSRQREIDVSLLERNEKDLLERARKVEHAEDAVKVVQAVSAIVQEKANIKITSIVTRCLETVFEEEAYEFKILFEEKRNKTEARIVFMRNGEELNPIDASGGGAIDVAAFALRVSCLMLSGQRKVMILDEPFKNLSEGYRPKMAKMVELLSKELQIQFIVVTHIEEFMMGNVIAL